MCLIAVRGRERKRAWLVGCVMACDRGRSGWGRFKGRGARGIEEELGEY